MMLGPDKEPSAQMTKDVIKAVTAEHPGLTLPQIMKMMAGAQWDFDGADGVSVKVQLPNSEEPIMVTVHA